MDSVTHSGDVGIVAQEARVVINAVAPYSHWGTSYIRGSCFLLALRADTKCALLHSFDHIAAKSNTVIVPCAGLIAVPSDLMTYAANKTLRSFAGPLTSIDVSTSAWEINEFTMSGESVATARTIAANVSKDARDAVRTGFALSPGKWNVTLLISTQYS